MTQPFLWNSPIVLAQGGDVTGVLGAESAPGQPAGEATTTAPGAPGGQPAQPASPFGGSFMLFLLPLLVFMVLMTMMSGRKERKKRAAMLGSIAKHDRVQTTGGIIGTIVEMRDSEMVLRVDDGSNTRITFARSAVSAILHKGGVGGADIEAGKDAA